MRDITLIYDLEELAHALCRHYPEIEYSWTFDFLVSNFVVGLKCTDGDKVGWCCLIDQNGIYFVDAHNEGLKAFDAIATVRELIKIAFDKYTDCVICVFKSHDTEDICLRKRLGFKHLLTRGDEQLFFKQKGT